MLSDDDLNIWKKWAQHWRFSSQTSFRIPEHLEEVSATWRQVSDLLTDDNFVPLDFVRHALLNSEEEQRRRDKHVPTYTQSGKVATAQFTQSRGLARLISNNDRIIRKWADYLTRNIKLLGTFLIKNAAVWSDFLDLVEKDEGGFSAEHINFPLLRNFEEWENFNVKELPPLLSSLYLAYVRTTHVGFLAHDMNQIHLNESTEDQEQILGYFVTLQSDENLSNIQQIWTIWFDRNKPPKPIQQMDGARKQSGALWMLGKSRRRNDGGNGVECRNLQKLFLTLWNALNQSTDEFTETLRDTKTLGFARPTYFLLMPVYAWSEAPRDERIRKIQRHHAGPLLGWVFHEYKDRENCLPTHHTQKLKQKFYRHVRSLSLMTEDLAASYLSGETEWSLSRKWRKNETAEEYMQRNFYHSCGWACDRFERRSFRRYFEFDEESTLLRVNLDRGLFSEEHSPDSKSKIAILKPNSLWLEPQKSAPEATDSYWMSVAEKARMFYQRCRAKAEQMRTAKLLGARSHREMQEFMWQHETRKLARALQHSSHPIVHDLIARHLVAMTYPAEGEGDARTEREDLALYWPAPFSITTRTAKEWILSIHDFACRRWFLSQMALQAETLGNQLKIKMDAFCQQSSMHIEWTGDWDELIVDASFPNPVRKFFVRIWLAAFANYFKHVDGGAALAPCMLDIRKSSSNEVVMLSQMNALNPNHPLAQQEKEWGTKDVLSYDLSNVVRWRGTMGRSVFGNLLEQEVLGMITFGSHAFGNQKRFVTEVPMPLLFFI